MEIRPATADDSGRIKTLAHDSLRSSYALSPQGIETLLAEEFDDETIEYESAEDVRQSITNMVGAEAVGRKGYSDRGGSMQGEIDEGAPDEPDSV